MYVHIFDLSCHLSGIFRMTRFFLMKETTDSCTYGVLPVSLQPLVSLQCHSILALLLCIYSRANKRESNRSTKRHSEIPPQSTEKCRAGRVGLNSTNWKWKCSSQPIEWSSNAHDFIIQNIQKAQPVLCLPSLSTLKNDSGWEDNLWVCPQTWFTITPTDRVGVLHNVSWYLFWDRVTAKSTYSPTS